VTTATAQAPSIYPFTEAEFDAAYREWGCNCGPSALAFALNLSLEAVRPAIPDFDRKRYTSPTMMKAALANLGISYDATSEIQRSAMFSDRVALVRVQWTGRWTKPGANPKWAYNYTHWIACWFYRSHGTPLVFDCNGGLTNFHRWQTEIVPLLVKDLRGGDGGWCPTHIWRLRDIPLPETRDPARAS